MCLRQEAPCPVQRIVLAARVTERLVLDPAAALIQFGVRQPDQWGSGTQRLAVLRRQVFPSPPSEPSARVSTHRALHDQPVVSTSSTQACSSASSTVTSRNGAPAGSTSWVFQAWVIRWPRVGPGLAVGRRCDRGGQRLDVRLVRSRLHRQPHRGRGIHRRSGVWANRRERHDFGLRRAHPVWWLPPIRIAFQGRRGDSLLHARQGGRRSPATAIGLGPRAAGARIRLPHGPEGPSHVGRVLRRRSGRRVEPHARRLRISIQCPPR